MRLRTAIAELRDCLRRRPQPVRSLSHDQLEAVVRRLHSYNERSIEAVAEYAKQPVPHGDIQLAVFNPESITEVTYFNHINVPTLSDMERQQRDSLKASFPAFDVDSFYAGLS